MYYTKLGISCSVYNKSIAHTSNKKFLAFEDPLYNKTLKCTYVYNNKDFGTIDIKQPVEKNLMNTYYGKTNEKIDEQESSCKSC